MKLRPTDKDLEALDLLLSIDRMDTQSAAFCESLAERDGSWTVRQCKWFDGLCERYL